MTADIRISVSFLDHPKTIKLKRRLGFEGVESLISLWLWARVNKPCGNLSGMDVEDIEIAARWNGKSGVFVNECLTLRWIDVNDSLSEKNDSEYSLHDWADHNPWAVGSEERSNASRFNRMAKTHPALYEKLKFEGKKGVSIEEFQELTKSNEPLTVVKPSLSPAPTPSPSPVPSPIDKKNEPQATTKEKKFDPILFRPVFVPENLWLAFIENRRFKKLQNSELALTIACNQFKEAVDKGHSIESCIGAFVEGKWTRFKVEWMDNLQQDKSHQPGQQRNIRQSPRVTGRQAYMAELMNAIEESENGNKPERRESPGRASLPASSLSRERH